MDKALAIAKGLALCKAAAQSRPEIKRTVLNDKEIKELTLLAINFPGAGVARLWNEQHPERPISADVVLKYHKHYLDNGEFFSPSRRGPKFLLEKEEEEEELAKVLQHWRSKGNAVDSSLVSSVGKGMYGQRYAGTVNSLFAFSNTWARSFMHRYDFRVRSATADRTVDAQTVVTEGVEFYKTISSIEGMVPELTFNFDEFFTCLGDNAKWTWESEGWRKKEHHHQARKDWFYRVRPLLS